MCFHMLKIHHITNTSEHTLMFLKYVVNEYVLMNLVALGNISALNNFEIWLNSVCIKY